MDTFQIREDYREGRVKRIEELFDVFAGAASEKNALLSKSPDRSGEVS